MSAVSQNLYDEVMQEFRKQGGGNIAKSFERQKAMIVPWIDDAVNNVGVDRTVDFLNDCIAFDQTYDGPMPFFNDLVEATDELKERGVERETRAFRSAVEYIGENQTMQRFTTGEDGMPQPTGENPNLPGKPEPKSHLEQALEHNRKELAFAERYGDEEGVRRFTRNIELIERDMAARPEPTQPDPQLKSAPAERPDVQIEKDTDATRDLDVDEIEHSTPDDVDTIHEGESTTKDDWEGYSNE